MRLVGKFTHAFSHLGLVTVASLFTQLSTPSQAAVRHILALQTERSLKPSQLYTLSSKASDASPDVFRVRAEFYDVAPLAQKGKAVAVVRRFVFGGFGQDRSYLWLLNFPFESYRELYAAPRDVHLLEVASSPDGKLIAFTEDRDDAYPRPKHLERIRLYDLRSHQVRDLSILGSTTKDSYPSFSADSSRLGFVRNTVATSSILVANTSNLSSVSVLTSTGAKSRLSHFTFSPDGQSCSYLRGRGKYLDLVVRNPCTKSGAETVLTSKAHRAYEPQWSPDGSKIAYLLSTPRGFSVQVYDLLERKGESFAGVSMPAFKGRAPGVCPSWSSDMEEIYFVSFLGSAAVFKVNLFSRKVTQLSAVDLREYRCPTVLKDYESKIEGGLR